VDGALPFVFNTGRIRDQWHTMTRTGKAAKLLAHIDEPFLAMHPDDLVRTGVRAGGLARVYNGHGEMLARVVASPDQGPGEVFAPIHWNGRFSGRARPGVLVNAVTDPLSGQPEFKHAPVAVEPWPAAWHGFVLTRAPLERVAEDYWTRIPGKACWRQELAGQDAANPWPGRLRELFGAGGDWIEMKDPAHNRYRAALLRGGHVRMICFFDRDAAALPPRHWLEALFEGEEINRDERVALLAGRPGKAAPDAGPIVCACFGVGRKSLEQAIAQGAASVEALGMRLKAGTNCGSCLPELKALLAAGRVS
jgi:assimilatory nitrate reductase catalytic subunit